MAKIISSSIVQNIRNRIFNKPKELLKLKEIKMPAPPKIKSQLEEVPKIKPVINKAPKPIVKKPRIYNVQKIAREEYLLTKIAEKVREKYIPGTPLWIKSKEKKEEL